MGDAKNRETAENDEMSAIEILDRLREIMGLTSSVSIIEHIEKRMVCIDDLALAVKAKLKKSDKGVEIEGRMLWINPGMPLEFLESSQSRLNYELTKHYMGREAKAMEEKQRIVTPSNGKIIV